MSGTIERYRQTFLLWARWPIFRVMVRIMAVLLAMRLLNMSDLLNYLWRWHSRWLLTPYEVISPAAEMLGSALLVAVPMMMVWQIRTQLTDWRSALLPRSRRTSLNVAAAIAAGILFVMLFLPTFLQMLASLSTDWVHWMWRQPMDAFKEQLEMNFGWQITGLGQSLLLAAVAGYVASWANPWLAVEAYVGGVVVLQGIGWNGVRWIQNTLGVPLAQWISYHVMHRIYFAGDAALLLSIATALELFGATFVVLALLWRRICRVSSGDASVKLDESLKWLGDILSNRRQRPAGDLAEAGIWRRVRHRRVIGLGSRFIWITAFLLAGAVSISPMLTHDAGHWLERNGYAFGVLFAAAAVSILAVGLTWPQRWASLGQVEMLRPMPRRQVLAEMGLAMLMDAAEISLATAAAGLIPIAIWSPGQLHSPDFWLAVAATILCQALALGALALIMIRNSTAALTAVLAMAVVAATGLISYTIDSGQLIPALIAAALGMALAAHAYHRWQTADML
jgi:hypothetical protein